MLLDSVTEPSVIEIRTPPLFTQTANKPCEGCRRSGRGMKHILLVKLCKHSSCSHQSLESYVVVFSQTEPSLSLGESGLAVQITYGNVSYVAALILTSPRDIHTAQSIKLLSVWISSSAYFCAFDLQDVSCWPRSLYWGLLTDEIILLLLAKSQPPLNLSDVFLAVVLSSQSKML